MASTTFVDNQTIIYASWLNDVNDMTYNGVVLNGILNGPTTLALQTGALDALTIDASQNVYAAKLSAGTFSASSITGTITGGVNASSFTLTNGIFQIRNTIADNYTITSGYNAESIGPVTVAPGKAVTVPSGSRWVVI